jgi:hypothetical protein
MRTTIATATFLLLGAGAATIGAKSNIHMLGSDTLRQITRGTIAGIPAVGALPAVAACPGTAGLIYDGTGSGNGGAAMRRGDQETAPMSSALAANQVCAPTHASLPQQGQEAEGLVFALDGLSITVKPGNAPHASCGGVAFNGTQGAKITVPGGCASYGCNAAGEYIPADERDYLRVLYFGVHGHSSATTARDCNSPVRRALVASYKNLFQNQATCTGGTCAGKPIKHVYRRDDHSGTTDVFASLVGIPGIYGGYNKLVHASGANQQSNGFCNAGDVGADHVTKGIHLGFDDSESPLTGPNWNTLGGDGDFADLDPIRVNCEEGDETCQGDGTSGLLQVVFPPALHIDLAYPPQDCEPGSVELVFDGAPYSGYFGRCGDGSPSLLGGCVIPYRPCTPGSPCIQPGAAPKTSGTSYMCKQVSGPGNCFALSPSGTSGIPGSECRGNNNWIRNVDGTLATEASLGASLARPVLGAFFRKHMTTPGDGGTGTCKLLSATDQIGCLVGNTEPCSIGFAGREATDGAGAPADGAAIKGIQPTKAAIQALVSGDPATFAGRYPLSRKLYFNSIVGFGSAANTTGDATGVGASGEELNLGYCLADQLYRPYWEASFGFIELPAAVNARGTYHAFCEDFAEHRRCSGGLRPGIKCTADADCPGFGSIPAGTCPATVTCSGAASDNDACANNTAATASIARQCVGGSNPGAACTLAADCTGGGVCSGSQCAGTSTYCNPATGAPCAAGVLCRNKTIPSAP